MIRTLSFREAGSPGGSPYLGLYQRSSFVSCCGAQGREPWAHPHTFWGYENTMGKEICCVLALATEQRMCLGLLILRQENIETFLSLFSVVPSFRNYRCREKLAPPRNALQATTCGFLLFLLSLYSLGGNPVLESWAATCGAGLAAWAALKSVPSSVTPLGTAA